VSDRLLGERRDEPGMTLVVIGPLA